MTAAYLRDPLYATKFDHGFGTLYTAVLRPDERSITYHWPDQDPWRTNWTTREATRGRSRSIAYGAEARPVTRRQGRVVMARLGQMYGPDVTFLGVDRCDLDDAGSFGDADVVILGAPFDGGTSYRSGAKLGPQAIRMTDYLPHDGSRPHIALKVDALRGPAGRRRRRRAAAAG